MLEHDKEFIEDNEARFNQTAHYEEPLTLGDIYLEQKTLVHAGTRRVWFTQNSIGAIRKYKVVHVSPSGIPYLRELNLRGRPSGRLRTYHIYETQIRYGTQMPFIGFSTHPTLKWVLDQEQLSAIILDQEIDPTAEGKEKSALFKAINRHNSSLRIHTKTADLAKQFIEQAKPGDVYWTTPHLHFVVKQLANALDGTTYLVMEDINKRKKKWSQKKVQHTRVYRDRPRSYTKERRNS